MLKKKIKELEKRISHKQYEIDLLHAVEHDPFLLSIRRNTLEVELMILEDHLELEKALLPIKAMILFTFIFSLLLLAIRITS